jgi:hypothetical protein
MKVIEFLNANVEAVFYYLQKTSHCLVLYCIVLPEWEGYRKVTIYVLSVGPTG